LRSNPAPGPPAPSRSSRCADAGAGGSSAASLGGWGGLPTPQLWGQSAAAAAGPAGPGGPGYFLFAPSTEARKCSQLQLGWTCANVDVVLYHISDAPGALVAIGYGITFIGCCDAGPGGPGYCRARRTLGGPEGPEDRDTGRGPRVSGHSYTITSPGVATPWLSRSSRTPRPIDQKPSSVG
jgi:hypothetical protein